MRRRVVSLIFLLTACTHPAEPRVSLPPACEKLETRVTILGAVARPGSISVRAEGAQLRELLADAGGLLPFAWRVQIRRRGCDGRVVVVMLRANQLDAPTMPLVAPGDVVMVYGLD